MLMSWLWVSAVTMEVVRGC